MKTLKEKYGKKKKERFDEIIDLIKDTKWDNDEEYDTFLDKIKKLEIKWKKEEVEKNNEYFLYRVLMKAGGNNLDVYMREQLDTTVDETKDKKNILQNVFDRFKRYKETGKEQKKPCSVGYVGHRNDF